MPPSAQFALVVVGEEGEVRVGTLADGGSIAAAQQLNNSNIRKSDPSSKHRDTSDAFRKYKELKQVFHFRWLC